MSNCRGCGKKIIWAVTVDGKKIPLDPTPPTYGAADDSEIHTDGQFIGRSRAMVSHFATCPKANDFSGSKKQAQL